MSISRKRAQDYAEKLLSRPRSNYLITLKRGKLGTSLLHNGKTITKCHKSKVGLLQAGFMAQSLGINLPKIGGRIILEVPAGVLYRAIAITSLDLRRPEAIKVLAQLLTTAEMQRQTTPNSDKYPYPMDQS